MRSSAILAAFLVASAGGLQAQTRLSAVGEAADRSRADSVGALRIARASQAEFERVRFAALPWSEEGGLGGQCDERVGRFCLRYGDPDDAEDDWAAPPEPPRVREARERLVTRLAGAAAVAPGDWWIAGQRVRYLLEAGRTDEAMAAARACRGERGWCLALEGFAAHRSGDFASSERAFDAALALMEVRRRREWTDLSRLLRPGEGGAYSRTRGAARAAAERRFWWLADPLWMDDGNDRRTEHFSRWVWDRLQDRARSTERIAWGEDLEQLVVRYGWPIGWERIRPRLHETGPASIITHYAPRAREFTPAGSALRAGAPLPDDTWDLHDARARTDYAPAYVTHFDSLPHQLAVFRRGGEAIVVAGYELDRDSVGLADTVQGGVVLAVDEARPMIVQVAHHRGAAGAVRVTASMDSAIVSVEAISRSRRRAARARYPVSLARPAAGGIALSDLLLLADPAARPTSLDDAWPGARSTVRFRAGERVGLFWEVYRGDASADSLGLAVSLSRRPAGGLRAVAERIGLAGGGGAPVRVRWSEEAGASPILTRALAVALPAQLSPGEYFLELTVHPAAGPPVTRRRSIFIHR